MKILIKNGILIIDGYKRIDNGAVLVEDNTITGIFKDYHNIDYDKVIDAKGNYIIFCQYPQHTSVYIPQNSIMENLYNPPIL